MLLFGKKHIIIILQGRVREKMGGKEGAGEGKRGEKKGLGGEGKGTKGYER